MIVPCDTRVFRYTCSDGRQLEFRPTERMEFHGAPLDDNPVRSREREPIWSARMFVGFNVGGEPVHELDDVIEVVRRVREAQQESPDASFIVQRGLYTSRGGELVEEDSAQVIILNFGPVKEFEREMIELSETLARELEQEVVILELQRGGVTQEVLEVVP